MANGSSGHGSGTGKNTGKGTAKAGNGNGSAAETTGEPVALTEPDPTPSSGSTSAASKPAASKPAGSKPAASKPAASKPAASKPAASKPAASKPAASKPAGKAASKGRARKPPPVVLAKPKPWGWIAAAVAVVVFAVAAIGYAVVQSNEKQSLADPNNIEGLVTKSFTAQQHSTDPIDYAESPPFGGEHDPVWADCMGAVYPIQIRNENAVHSLEHGAVWITYRPDLPQDQIDQLSSIVQGEGFVMMSPYAGLSSPISLQAWGKQLFVDSAADPRIAQFITALRQNPSNTPEVGASCDNPAFLANPIPEEGTGTSDPSAVPTPDPSLTDPAVTTAP